MAEAETGSAPTAQRPVTDIEGVYRLAREQQAEGGLWSPQVAAALSVIVDAARRDEWDLYRAWIESAGMTWGDQFGNYDEVRHQWADSRPVPSSKLVRIQANHMHRLTQLVVSLHCAEPLNLGCVTPTSDMYDLAVAETCDKILESYMRRLNFEQLRQEQCEGSVVFGGWYVWPRFDRGAGRYVERQQEMIDPVTGQPSHVEWWTEPEGDVVMESLSPFEVTHDPNATLTYAGRWICVETEASIDELLNHPEIPDAAKGSIAPTAWGDPTSASDDVDRLRAMHPRAYGPDPMTAAGARTRRRDATRVRYFYTVPTPEYPQGLCLAFTSNAVIHVGINPAWPSPEKQTARKPRTPWPVYRFLNYSLPKSPRGHGSAAYAIPRQKELNGSLSKRATILRRVAHPTLVKPKGLGLKKTDEPDQQLEVPSTMQPGSIYYLQSPNVPMELMQEEQAAVAFLEEVYGVHDATAGKTPVSGTPAKVMEQAHGRDVARRRPIENRWSDEWAEVALHILELVREHVDTEQVIADIGESARASVVVFTGSSIPAGTDVVVFQDIGRPRDPATRLAWARTLVETGLARMDDPTERAQIREFVGAASGRRRLDDTLRADRLEARDEHLELYAGRDVTVEFWQNDTEHLDEHFGEMKSAAWRKACRPLPNDPPEVVAEKMAARQRWLDHVGLHQAAMQHKAGAAAPPPMPGGQPGGQAGATPEGTMPAGQPAGV